MRVSMRVASSLPESPLSRTALPKSRCRRGGQCAASCAAPPPVLPAPPHQCSVPKTVVPGLVLLPVLAPPGQELRRAVRNARMSSMRSSRTAWAAAGRPGERSQSSQWN